ncbi:HTH-type transcriptional regulator DmlR [Pseudomonas ogarae]|uniref:LysR family transcriptional regulator n=1 Tax=Pseudomonas ogarae (strain DSM 112162 / CECT 30235 / F113) TaxID=1114970 RepID=UPI000BB32790|nr:LysR family transcriptional regulator [Pseudomonas ogarae]PBJ24840.1 HTH-type transcriptional regulator DmlR [Pseudomonas ogarae]
MFSSERLKGLDVFVCVAESGSFKAAAERMSLTSSAISKSVARLESRLGVRLFERTTRRVSLTDAGRAFLHTCTGVLADLEEAELSLHAENTEPRGRVRIDLPGAFGRSQVLPVVLRCLQDFPQLVPHISFSDGFIDPVREGVDIVIRLGGAGIWPATWGHRYLGSEWHIFCASPAYLARHGTPLIDLDLEHHQCIAYGWPDGNVSPWNFAGHHRGETLRKQVSPTLVVGDGEGLVIAVLAGCGIAQLPSWLVQRQLDEGTLVEVLPQWATDGMAINLAWQKNRETLPKVAALLDVLTASLAQTAGGRGQRL